MANICAVSLIARGFKTKSDLNRFVRILTENTEGELWLPYFDVYCETDYNSNTVCSSGSTKWSADRMLNDYIQLAKQDNPDITSVEELSFLFGIGVEILATEPGFDVGEHFIIENGKMTLEEYFDYSEYEAFETYEEFIEDNGDVIDEKTWQKHVDDGDEWISVGEPETPFGVLNNRNYPKLTD